MWRWRFPYISDASFAQIPYPGAAFSHHAAIATELAAQSRRISDYLDQLSPSYVLSVPYSVCIDEDDTVVNPELSHETLSAPEQNLAICHNDGPLVSGGGLSESVDSSTDDDDRQEHVHIRDIPAFNAPVLWQVTASPGIKLDDLDQVPGHVRNSLCELVDRALLDAPQGSVLSVVLRCPSLASDVHTVLHVKDEYKSEEL
ncbi:uncharacterized protein V6R79_001970 [Siganus canaliculatus]